MARLARRADAAGVSVFSVTGDLCECTVEAGEERSYPALPAKLTLHAGAGKMHKASGRAWADVQRPESNALDCLHSRPPAEHRGLTGLGCLRATSVQPFIQKAQSKNGESKKEK